MNSTATLINRHFEALSDAVNAAPPLEGLDPDAYARGHAAFEVRSNQRGLIADWLVSRLAERTSEALSVLSVGCGDGALDAEVAQRLVEGRSRARSVRYVGVEPFEGSAHRFLDRMTLIESDRLSADVHHAHFADVQLAETFDAVTFVHSMYYVPDVLSAVRSAAHLSSDDGEVLVVSAPRGVLNLLAGLLAPSLEGHHQWFSDDVRGALESGDVDFATAATIDAVIDLTDADDDVLDFTVQAQLTPALRVLVREYLAAVSSVPGRSVVAHPVDCYTVPAECGRAIRP